MAIKVENHLTGESYLCDAQGNRLPPRDVNSQEGIRKLKAQRRRNAKTIEERNAEIRDLKWQIQEYRESFQTVRSAYKIVYDLLQEHIKKHGGL